MDRKIRCYDGEKVVGVVNYTDNLDHWDGHNYTSGSTGHHLGIGRTNDGRFYLCYGTQWQGERDFAEIVSEKTAKSAVLEHNTDLYEEIFGEPLPEL